MNCLWHLIIMKSDDFEFNFSIIQPNRHVLVAVYTLNYVDLYLDILIQF